MNTAIKSCLTIALAASLILVACGGEPCATFDQDGKCGTPAPDDGADDTTNGEAASTDPDTDNAPADRSDGVGSSEYGVYTDQVKCINNCCSTGTCRCWSRDGSVRCTGICAPN